MSDQTVLAEAMRSIVGAKNVFTDARSVGVFSRDAFYYSPVLREQLGDKLADVVVAPQTLEELQQVVRYAAQHHIPLTPRGAGTGNYGQCVPLQGGVVVTMHKMNRILGFDTATGVMQVEAGARMGQLERLGREAGWELKCYPSTWATATIGGFIGGGFGGVGSIRHGVIWDDYLKSVTVMEMTPEAKLYRLEGQDVAGFIHAYAQSGLIVELEVNLAPLVGWEEAVICLPDYGQALRLGHLLATDAGLDKRLIAMCEWPIPRFFSPLVQAGGVLEGHALMLLELGQGATPEVAERAAAFGGRLTYTAPGEQYHKGKFCLSDFSWNHTTLWALKDDPGWTYLQSRFDPDPEVAIGQCAALRAFHGERLALHHEYFLQSGTLGLAALDLIYYQTEAEVYAATAKREELGIHVADPHSFYLDSDPRWGGEAVLRAKARYNPLNLLNPGKLRAEPLLDNSRVW